MFLESPKSKNGDNTIMGDRKRFLEGGSTISASSNVQEMIVVKPIYGRVENIQ